MSESTTTSLYDPALEGDSCGFGLIANLDDQPSHWVVQTAIKSLTRLTHRGAVAADGKTGDGCGLLIKFPQEFLRSVAIDLGFRVNDRFAAGTVFLSRDLAEADCARGIIDAAVSETGLEVAGWRDASNRCSSTRPTACSAAALIACCSLPGDAPKTTFRKRTSTATWPACHR
jgi:glutamate synthase (NADPH/NADH) large chain